MIPEAQMINESPVPATNTSLNEDAQLPTPETMMDHTSDTIQAPPPTTDTVDTASVPFSDFLRDVLYQQSLSNSDRAADPQGLAVLDFCDDANLDLRDTDFGLLDNWNVGGIDSQDLNVQEAQEFRSEESAHISSIRSRLVKIWTKSPWRWEPRRSDTGYTEQSYLPLPARDANETRLQENGRSVDQVVEERLQDSVRDKILAIVLSTCRDDSVKTRVRSSFPSTDTMDSWINIFLASHLCSVSSWVHFGSFSLNTQWPEWLGMAASAGAALTPVPALRRFGFALQEAVRLTIPARFEENNTKIADIGLVQALMLVQDVGLWSGNRRKMEIAECHLPIPIAMMRYRGKFQRSSYHDVVIDPSDEGEVLEDKWKTWYELESWKR